MLESYWIEGMKKYKGKVYIKDAKRYNLPEEKLEFVATGYWVGQGRRHITSYKLVDTQYEEKMSLELQFSRDIHNIFYVETEDKIY